MQPPHQPFRLESRMPVTAVKTFGIKAPKHSHFRPATCAEVDCSMYLTGWKSTIDETSELGQEQAYYIRNGSGRRFTEDRNTAPGMTVFVFEAGQKCFRAHDQRLDKPELFIVRGGDWRGNPTGEFRQHANAADWVDDFGNHQDQLADQLNKG